MKKRISVDIDEKDKEQAVVLFKNLGMDMTTAITLFLKQSVREQRLPFRPEMNPKTIQAIHEANTGQGETFANLDDWKAQVNDGHQSAQD